MKKIPISFNEEEEAKVKEIADLIGIGGVYGDFPKAIKFSINLTLSAIKNPEKVYSSLTEEELAYFFASVTRSEKKKRLLEKAHNLEKEAQKV